MLSLNNTAQDAMVTTVAAACNNTIVVLNVGGPRVLDAWITHPNIRAVLYSSFLGQESGDTIADILYGDVNPSGKLIHTIAMSELDYPAQTCGSLVCDFDEGLYTDYRYFDKQNKTVRFPFGHGLSYTTFKYSDVAVTKTNSTALASRYPTGPMALGGEDDLFNEVISVQTTIQNSGSVDGAEVAQLYLSFPDEAAQPVRILRGFEKTSIAVGETATVTFSLRRRDVSYWDVVAQKWAIANGEYTISIGSSSRDLRSTATFTI